MRSFERVVIVPVGLPDRPPPKQATGHGHELAGHVSEPLGAECPKTRYDARMGGADTTGDGSPRGKGRRSVSGRNRAGIIAAAADRVRSGAPLRMRAVAAEAAVSRSTLYRHFTSPAELRHALRQDAVDRAERAIRHAVAGRRPAIAELRGVVSALVEVGAELPLDLPETHPRDSTSAAAREALRTLASRLAQAAGVEPLPHDAWLEPALEQF